MKLYRSSAYRPRFVAPHELPVRYSRPSRGTPLQPVRRPSRFAMALAAGVVSLAASRAPAQSADSTLAAPQSEAQFSSDKITMPRTTAVGLVGAIAVLTVAWVATAIRVRTKNGRIRDAEKERDAYRARLEELGEDPLRFYKRPER